MLAWETNVVVGLNVHGWAEETIDYRTLLAAVCLAEAAAADGPDVAQRAVEENALADGMDLGVAAFGSIHPTHHVTLDPEALELAVRLARRFAEGATAADEVPS